MIALRSMSHSSGKKFAEILKFTQGVQGVYGQFANPGQTYRDVLGSLASRGSVYCYTHKGCDKVLAMHGYVPLWEGVAEIWIAQTEDGAACSHSDRRAMLVRGIRLHHEMMDQWGLHRLQTTSPHDSYYHERMKRVAKIAGFQYEGTMRRYSVTGVDCDVWSLTKET